MRGLKREERHRWHGQPGHWTCTRCHARRTGGTLDDGLCRASMGGQLDYSGRKADADGDEVARPTRLDTPETVNESSRQRGLGELFRSTGKGQQVASDPEGAQ